MVNNLSSEVKTYIDALVASICNLNGFLSHIEFTTVEEQLNVTYVPSQLGVKLILEYGDHYFSDKFELTNVCEQGRLGQLLTTMLFDTETETFIYQN